MIQNRTYTTREASSLLQISPAQLYRIRAKLGMAALPSAQRFVGLRMTIHELRQLRQYAYRWRWRSPTRAHCHGWYSLGAKAWSCPDCGTLFGDIVHRE